MLLTNEGITEPDDFPLTVDLILDRWLDASDDEITRGFAIELRRVDRHGVV
ncbi:hypothetical protein OPKNFCMD_6846 [Methylobacterium crusticola]|uniref:Uncharacterized protein n=1 Tax=Methylobacterium crusticola TaxID=1697972 RepID=A0ABQ4RA55_9HYPH|nr:hypothetical protein [Methylobacterium crusticola]GJD54065.1 hypothetical protein OPKNFCMD_6846 [Methylobacterium crusticola]